MKSFNCFFFHLQAINVIKSKINKERIFQIVCEVKSEQKLAKLFDVIQKDFDQNLLSIMIECSFTNMITKFKHDCFQHNPHMNYLKLSPILKHSMNILCDRMDGIFAGLDQNSENPDVSQGTALNHVTTDIKDVMVSLCTFLKCTLTLQQQCMIYAEVSVINKFLSEQIFRKLDFQRLVQFSLACLSLIENLCTNECVPIFEDLISACDCLAQIIRIQAIFNDSRSYFDTDESHGFFNRLLLILYEIVRKHLASKSFLEMNQLQTILDEQNQTDKIETDAALSYAKAIFVSVFVESSFHKNGAYDVNIYSDENYLNSFREMILLLIIDTMRSESFYFFAVTPREIINSFEWQHNQSSNRTITFQSVPIDCLNEIEIVEKFLKR